MAVKFSHPIEDELFSAAELQGYLLKRKKDPRKAREEIGNWVEDMLKVKRAGGK